METGPGVRCRSQAEASKGVQAVQAGLYCALWAMPRHRRSSLVLPVVALLITPCMCLIRQDTDRLLALRFGVSRTSRTNRARPRGHRPTRAARAQPGPAALASVGTPALWLVRERNTAAPRSGRPSAPALQTRARFRHPLAEK